MQRTRLFLLTTTALIATASALLLLGGCANTTTTKIYHDAKGNLVVEYPKDLVAEGVDIDGGPKPHIKIARWQSRSSTALTTAQGQREAADVNASSALVQDAVQAAVKSQVP